MDSGTKGGIHGGAACSLQDKLTCQIQAASVHLHIRPRSPMPRFWTTAEKGSAHLLMTYKERMLIQCSAYMLFRVTWTHFQTKVACSSKCQMSCVIFKLLPSCPCAMSFELMTASSPLDARQFFVIAMTLLRGLSTKPIIVPAKVSVSPNYQTVMFRERARLHGRFPKHCSGASGRVQIRKPRLYAITMT